MSKSIKKKKYNSYNPTVIEKLKSKYGVTVQFIHQSLRGDRVSETSAKICSEYIIIEKGLKDAMSKL